MSAPSRVQLCRVALLVGEDIEIDYTLPAAVPLIAVTEDLVPRINEQLRRRGHALLDVSHTYQLCRPDGRALDPQRSLDEAGVLDGDLLWLMPTEATEVYQPVVENVSTAIARAAARQFTEMDAATSRRVAGWLTAALMVFAVAMLARLWWLSGGWVPAAVSWALTAVLAITAWLCARARDGQRRRAADGFAWSALVPAGAAGAMSVPGQPGFWHVLLGVVVVMAAVVMLAALTGRHLVAVSLIITVGAVAAAVAAVEASGWHVRPERIAVVALLAVLLIVTFATNLGVVGSGVPVPVFPSVTEKGVFETAPGAPRDTVSPVPPSGAEPPERIAEWARRGNQIVTGVLAGAGIAAAVAAGYAVTPGRAGGWRFLAFTLAICLILLLRSRSFVDRLQCTALVVAAVAAVAAVIGRYAFAGASTVTTLWCVAATAGVAVVGVLAGLVVPSARFTAPVRRIVEIGEYVLLALVIPWALWLLGAYSAVRNTVHGS